jgi:hypothetical protein
MSIAVPVAYPKTNGIHVTAKAWADPQLKAGVLRMIDEHRINAVELDLKDEDGVVGYDSQVKLANEIGASSQLHLLGRAGRAARPRRAGHRPYRGLPRSDPLAGGLGRREQDWVLQTPDGQPLGAYGGFTNYVRPEVRPYNLAIAQEAAWPRGRHHVGLRPPPRGRPSTMVVPGLTGRSSDEIGAFLAEGHALLRPLGVYQAPRCSASRPRGPRPSRRTSR